MPSKFELMVVAVRHESLFSRESSDEARHGNKYSTRLDPVSRGPLSLTAPKTMNCVRTDAGTLADRVTVDVAVGLPEGPRVTLPVVGENAIPTSPTKNQRKTQLFEDVLASCHVEERFPFGSVAKLMQDTSISFVGYKAMYW